ncbi:non-structural maintenance of chromosomes element 1 [Microdochium nivale]|nr:non-structural maintenance of chromosomes element 1 [Microdochium nivale]
MEPDDDDDGDALQGHYADGNRAFLQALMSRGSMTFAEARPVFAAIFTAQEAAEAQQQQGMGGDSAVVVSPDQVTLEDMESYVAAASAAVSGFDMEVRSMRQQMARTGDKNSSSSNTAEARGGDRVWALVNTTSDGLAQLATLHSAEEIAFVKRVLDAMFEKYNTPRIEAMCLDSMQANKLRIPPPPAEDTTMVEAVEEDEGNTTQLNPTQTIKGLKSSEAEAVMHSMVDEGWFDKTREGFYMLSSRGLLELRSWLVDAYNDPDAEDGEWRRIKHCEACRDIVTVGKRCPERDCHMRLHEICEDAFWRTRRDRGCPRCKTAWPGRGGEHKTFVGPKAITETDAYQRGRRKSGKGRSSNLAEQIMHEDGDEEGEEEADDDEGDER